mmetsp:Transcript_34100/g.58322  ORF Transcript_34100/g.58322 Transcript_34100/m.58322 type:complete len:239 (-) Transcript_34100:137-853(-)
MPVWPADFDRIVDRCIADSGAAGTSCIPPHPSPVRPSSAGATRGRRHRPRDGGPAAAHRDGGAAKEQGEEGGESAERRVQGQAEPRKEGETSRAGQAAPRAHISLHSMVHVEGGRCIPLHHELYAPGCDTQVAAWAGWSGDRPNEHMSAAALVDIITCVQQRDRHLACRRRWTLGSVRCAWCRGARRRASPSAAGATSASSASGTWGGLRRQSRWRGSERRIANESHATRGLRRTGVG